MQRRGFGHHTLNPQSQRLLSLRESPNAFDSHLS